MAVLERMIGIRNNRTIYRDGDCAIKVFAAGTDKTEPLREAWKLAAVETTSLSTPRFRGVERLDGKWALFTDYVAGKTLDRLMRENPGDAERYLESFAGLHYAVHSTAVDSAPLRSMERMSDEINRRIAESGLPATIRFALHERLEKTTRTERLCHGDFNPSNAVFSREGKPYILDWEDAGRGDPRADAAITVLEFRLAGEDSAAESYLRFYCGLAGCEETEIEEWIPVMAAALSVGRIKSERARLLQWAKEI